MNVPLLTHGTSQNIFVKKILLYLTCVYYALRMEKLFTIAYECA
jgi:hypothetical protein